MRGIFAPNEQNHYYFPKSISLIVLQKQNEVNYLSLMYIVFDYKRKGFI